jgi:16S rRNA (uracil1498-N3)-methyltransferase
VNPLLRNSAAHVFVESLQHPSLAEHDDHHLRRVLRLRDGAHVSMSDGRGSWCMGELHAGGFTADGVVRTESPADITVAAALPKGDRLEWMVQKLTEVGVNAIMLCRFRRGVVRWDDERADRHLARLQRVAREAAMQARRVTIPHLRVVGGAGDLPLGHGWAVADPEGGDLPAEVRAVVIGPEGGFDDGEVDESLPRVWLGPTILRVETAAVVAASRLVVSNSSRT